MGARGTPRVGNSRFRILPVGSYHTPSSKYSEPGLYNLTLTPRVAHNSAKLAKNSGPLVFQVVSGLPTEQVQVG